MSLRGRYCGLLYISAEKDLIHTASIFAIQFVIPAFILTILYASMIIKLRKPNNFQEKTMSISTDLAILSSMSIFALDIG